MDERWQKRTPDASRPAQSGPLSVSEAAAMAGVTRQAVHAWIARGHLTVVPSADLSGIWLEATTVARFLAARHAARTVGVRIETVRQWQLEGHVSDGD
jgi:hypothetical protein